MVVVHEVVALFLEHSLHTVARPDEPREDLLDLLSLVARLRTAALHGHDAQMVLLVTPHEQIIVVVAEDTPPVRRVPAHPRCQQQRRIRFLVALWRSSNSSWSRSHLCISFQTQCNTNEYRRS